MAGPVWNQTPRSPHRRALTDLTFQPPARAGIESDKPPEAAPTTDALFVSRPLSNITEVTSQSPEERGKENVTLQPGPTADKPKPLRPYTASFDKSPFDPDSRLPTDHSSRRDRNATTPAAPGNSLHPGLPSSISTETTLTSPEDSASPLAAASGRVGTLLIQIHRNRSRALIYGQLFVVGALSHQTWVSGEVLFFDVEIYNSTEKSIKKVEIQLERTTMLHVTPSHGTLAGREVPVEATSEILAKWLWKKGEDGWCGISPHTQAAKIWNPIVPAGQATMNTHRFEVRYYLTIFVPCTFSKTASVQIPITVISPNSLGPSRLRQHLHHAATVLDHRGLHVEDDSPERREGRRARPSADHALRNTSRCNQQERSISRRSHDIRKEVETNQSIFMTSNPIPRASDELLSEMLQKLQQTALSPTQLARLSAHQHRKGLSAPAQSIPAMRPLSAIGARLRRRSSEDVRTRASVADLGLLVPPTNPAGRASFDDDLLRPVHQRQHSKDLRLQQYHHYHNSGEYFDSPGTLRTYGDSSSSLDDSEFDRFLRERHSFQVARRTSGNPFFKGSLNKERLRSSGQAYRAAKNRWDDNVASMGDYGRYEFRDLSESRQPRNDRPVYKSMPGSKSFGRKHAAAAPF